MIYDIYIYNLIWVDTRWQQYIKHLHTNDTQSTEKGEFGKSGPCSVLASYTLAFALQLRKNHRNTSVSSMIIKVIRIGDRYAEGIVIKENVDLKICIT
jgi:hypothetical protein